MISRFWKSVGKWQRIFNEACNGKSETSWFSWFCEKCLGACGYCTEFCYEGKEADSECTVCPLYKQKICVMKSEGSTTLFWRLRKACKESKYNKILVLTHLILEAVSNPKNMKYFKKR